MSSEAIGEMSNMSDYQVTCYTVNLGSSPEGIAKIVGWDQGNALLAVITLSTHYNASGCQSAHD